MLTLRLPARKWTSAELGDSTPDAGYKCTKVSGGKKRWFSYWKTPAVQGLTDHINNVCSVVPVLFRLLDLCVLIQTSRNISVEVHNGKVKSVSRYMPCMVRQYIDTMYFLYYYTDSKSFDFGILAVCFALAYRSHTFVYRVKITFIRLHFFVPNCKSLAGDCRIYKKSFSPYDEKFNIFVIHFLSPDWYYTEDDEKNSFRLIFISKLRYSSS